MIYDDYDLIQQTLEGSQQAYAVVLLILGFGNRQYLARFQIPYSFEATTEMTVDIMDTPIVANLDTKPDERVQIESTNLIGKNNNPEQQPKNASAEVSEAQGDEIVRDSAQWNLPEKAKARFGKGGINVIQFSPDGRQLAVGSSIGVWLYTENRFTCITKNRYLP